MTEAASARDTHDPAGADTETGEGGGKRHALKRRTYVAMRLAEIGEAIKRLAAERGELGGKIEGHGEAKTDEVRDLRHRRLYVAARLEILRAEQQDLNHERKETQAADKAAGASEKAKSKGKAKKAVKA